MRFARHDRGDHGFAMAEVIVAMTLLATLLTASAGLLVRTTSVAGQNVRRESGANLLTRQLELARGTALADLPEGTTTTSKPVGGTTYAIEQNVRYVSSSDGTSLCDGSSGSLLYKLVTVRVTWPDMQAVAPVRGDVLRAVGVGVDGSDASTGALAILVKDANGALRRQHHRQPAAGRCQQADGLRRLRGLRRPGAGHLRRRRPVRRPPAQRLLRRPGRDPGRRGTEHDHRLRPPAPAATAAADDDHARRRRPRRRRPRRRRPRPRRPLAQGRRPRRAKAPSSPRRCPPP